LVASSDDGLTGTAPSVPVPAHKAVLVNTQFPILLFLIN
jgi:speckle-type POZ protein